jgi:hypothetical protein
MSYADDQPRDSAGRWTSGGSGQRYSKAAQEKRALLNKFGGHNDYAAPGSVARPTPEQGPFDKIMSGLRQQYGANAPSEERVREIMQTAGTHSLGIHTSIKPSLED